MSLCFGRGSLGAWFTRSAVLACALVGFAGSAAWAQDPGQQGQQGQMYGGGSYDNQSIEDDWFYDSYSTKKGFGAEYYAQDNIIGNFDDTSMNDDWYFDQYEISEQARPGAGRIGTPRPGENVEPMPGEEGQQDEQGALNRSDFQGKVEAIKEVEVVGGGDNHLVALLSDGDTRYVVDLGPAKALGDVKIQIGESVTGKGRLGRVGDRVVLFADTLDRQGKPMSLKQDLKLQSRPIAREPAKAQALSGEILKLKEVQTEGAQSHTVALVTTDDGKQMAVDLGPADTFETFDINEGDTIKVNGRMMPIGEHLVLWADQLDVKGNPVNLRGGDQQPRGRGPRGTK